MEKFLENLSEAEKAIRLADHLIYVTYPIVKDKRMLLKIIAETKNAIALCINSILQHDYIYKKVRLYSDPEENFRIFREKCAQRYGITSREISKITELFDLVSKHKKSPLDFVRDSKLVIISENLRYEIITVEKAKEFILIAKNLLLKVEKTLKSNYY